MFAEDMEVLISEISRAEYLMYPSGRSVFFGGYLYGVSFYDRSIKGRFFSISCL